MHNAHLYNAKNLLQEVLLRLNGKQIYLAGEDFTLEANLSFSLDHKYSLSEG